MTQTGGRVNELPTIESVEVLPRLLDVEMPEEYLDANGHVNIRHYMALHDAAAWEFFERVGVDDAYFHTRRKGFFDAEHHLRYFAEALVGDRVAVHGRVVNRSNRALHCLWLMVDRTNRRVANTFEFVTVHVDLEQRRPTPIPPDIAERIDAMLAEHEALPWPAPVSGCMAIGVARS
jgi:acyl-CoA thioester hydrolase